MNEGIRRAPNTPGSPTKELVRQDRACTVKPISLPLAVNIDAPSWLLEQQQPRRAIERLGDRDLLLVAAGKRADALRNGVGSYRKTPDRFVGVPPHALLLERKPQACDVQPA